ncbi:MAG: nitroreductase family protein [Candidatus Omnitrophica bacterium]|nr:nitroreductase family protein [Candidatus Omnitrophota bacterium]
MDVMEAIKKRHSTRSYLDKPVEEEKLKKVLEAARLAPSANNYQEWRYIVVKDKNTREKLIQAAKGQKFVAEAPIILVACAVTDNHKMTCGQLCYPIDVAISLDHLSLAAVEEGLGTCWIGAFYEDEVKKILAIPPEVHVVELMTLGYPKALSEPMPRKDLKEIVKYEKWTE